MRTRPSVHEYGATLIQGSKSLHTADDELHNMTAATVAKLGTISVEFSRIRTTGPSVATDYAKSLQQSVAINEKQKKLGGHHTTYVSAAPL